MSTEDPGDRPSGPDGPDGRRAADVFAADLRPRPGGPLRHVLRIAGAFVAQLAWQLIPSPAVHDIVVFSRSDGRELLRVPAEDPLLPGDLLAQIRAELERLDPDTFLAAWGARRPAPGGDPGTAAQ
jgi:hypothetical protein